MKRFSAQGITLVMVYHATKGKIGDKQAVDRISGSGIFARDASTMLTLCEHVAEPDAVVINAIARNHAPIKPKTAIFNEGAFALSDIAAVEKTSMTKATRTFSETDLRACFSIDPTNYGDTLSNVRARLGCGRDRAKDEITRAIRDGIVYAEPRGRQTVYMIRPNMD